MFIQKRFKLNIFAERKHLAEGSTNISNWQRERKKNSFSIRLNICVHHIFMSLLLFFSLHFIWLYFIYVAFRLAIKQIIHFILYFHMILYIINSCFNIKMSHGEKTQHHNEWHNIKFHNVFFGNSVEHSKIRKNWFFVVVVQ